MSITNDAIYEEYTEFYRTKRATPIWKYTIEIVTPEYQFTTAKFVSLNREQYFTVPDESGAPCFTDNAAVMVKIGRATLRKFIIPYRDELKILVHRQQSTGDGSPSQFPIETKRYKGILLTRDDPSFLNTGRDVDTEQEEELNDMVDTCFELTDTALDDIRMKRVGCVIREKEGGKGVNLADVIRVLMSDGAKTPSSSMIEEDYEGIRGVDVVALSNTNVRDNVVIPPETKAIDIPDYLQREYGLYTTGVGCYLMDGRWYVYPARDTSQFEKRNRTLTIILLPSQEGIGSEQTYRLKGGQLYVVAIGPGVVDDSAAMSAMLNDGNAVRFVPASKFNDLCTTSNNKTTYNRADNMVQQGTYEQTDGRTNVMHTDRAVTDNPFPALSRISHNKGRYLNITWQNADPWLLYPGMPVRVIYNEMGTVKSTSGLLAGTAIDTLPVTARFVDDDARTVVKMVLYVD